MSTPVAVIGAGPYGLSAAAHLQEHGLPVRVFGQPMVSWRTGMPAGMLLASPPAASSIGVPRPGHTLGDFCAATGEGPCAADRDLVPVETFVRYGQWVQRRLVPGLEQVRVVSVDRRGDGFELKLDSGEQVGARAVVVATGLTGLAQLPPELAAAIPDGPSATGPVSHSSQHRDLSALAGRDVVVIGAGQSALESAVLLTEAGAAAVRVVARGPAAVGFGAPPDRRPRPPFGHARSRYAPAYRAGAFRWLPVSARRYLGRRVPVPLGAWWLRERFTDRVRVTQGRRIVRATVRDGRPVLALRGADGQGGEVVADHVLAATGYRMDLAALDFLGQGLRTGIVARAGGPLLDAGFGSSVPGLYFTGLPAAASFGPLMRFVCGTDFASPRLARAVARAYG
ncbi:FAD-dependent oxidoreductase [Streptomyces tubercidicus]|uniref:Monooxygenase n=1 Tax=Streptomyces tubercidicus TaxID=47759 RepID=A0A640UTB6_9ACTN|nr:FAD-dependent oxidoreductase [Streptomyces tubercidicus]WAU13434.1 lysine N(6)-hydroxylase/L-ornithine N(5)-oxygenase family protein [Streptomyces tubercidicus]GFE39039.1 monooxygenase [Streptomyces tubercidicus]